MMRPALLVSDCHLSPFRRDGTAEALARLLVSHPEAEVVLNGDTWDLSCELTSRPVGETLAEWVLQAPPLVAALAAKLARGIPVTVVPGNHDASLGDSGACRALCIALRLSDAAPLRAAPWWRRRGALHVEHGHVYDPDNAPLFTQGDAYSQRDEPLGVAITRRFVAPNRAFAFAHAHETTPIAGLACSLRHFGRAAPRLIFAYYRTAVALTLEASNRQSSYDHEESMAAWRNTMDASPAARCRPMREDAELGSAASVAYHRSEREERERLAGELRGCGELLSRDTLGKLSKLLPAPTHTNGAATFERLYLDRSLAFAAIGLGLGVGLSSFPGSVVAGSGASYLALSLLRRHNRYSGALEARLASAAHAIAAITGAERVVFGHTHTQASDGAYVNLGAFGVARRGLRHFAYANQDGQVSLEHCSVS